MTSNFLKVTALIFLFAALAGCEEDNNDSSATTTKAYVRFIDIQHGTSYNIGNTHFSTLKWDEAFFGMPALDSVEVPKYTVRLFGDFILGRARPSFINNGVDIRTVLYVLDGGLDHYGAGGALDIFSGHPNNVVYRPGLSTERSAYFPNLSHVVPVAPIRNGIDYYKWAAMDAGTHSVSFEKIRADVSETGRTYDFSFDNEPFAAETKTFDAGATYTMILSNADRNATTFTMVGIKEDTDQNFSTEKGYVRFVNTIPMLDNAVPDPATESIDVYVSRYTKVNDKDSLTTETLAAADLKRFDGGSIAYIPLDFLEFYRENKGRGILSYVFKVYPKGESAAVGSTPLSQHIMNMFGTYSSGDTEIPMLYISGDHIYPTIHTVLLGSGWEGNAPQFTKVRNIYYSLESAAIRQAYMDAAN